MENWRINDLKVRVTFNSVEDGVYFRNEPEGLAGSRNRLEQNVIENNGVGRDAAGIRVRGQTRDLVFASNQIRDTRTGAERRQSEGVRLDEQVGSVEMNDNQIDAAVPLRDERAAAARGASAH